MKIALTGATGFVGRYAAARLAGAGHGLRCWYRASGDRGDMPGSIEWLEGGLDRPESAEELVSGCDAVVHAALARWSAGFRKSAEVDLLKFTELNLQGTLRLMVAARKAGVKRFVFVSTCAVHDVVLSDRKLDEAHPLWSMSHYGAHKAAVEAFVHSFGLGEGWPVCAVRPTGIYGMARPVEKSKWFELVRGVMKGEAVRSAAGGKEVHVADVARAIELLLGADEKAITGQSFNCYDMYVSDQAVARIAKELTGSKSEIADLNRGPKNQIEVSKIKALGMTFGGEGLLRKTVGELVAAGRASA